MLHLVTNYSSLSYVVVRVSTVAVIFVAEGKCIGFRRESGQFLHAGLHSDAPLVREHVEGLRLLLAEARDLYHCYDLYRNHLLQSRDRIQRDSGISIQTMHSTYKNHVSVTDFSKHLNFSQSRGSCTSFVLGFVTFMSIGGFPSFVEDMKVITHPHTHIFIHFSCEKLLSNSENSLETFAEKFLTGFPERAAQRALRSPRVRHREHVLRDAVPAPHIRFVGHGLLLHGAPPPRIRALLVLRSVPLFEHYGCREPNDGDRERNPEFPHGDHNWSRHSGMCQFFVFRQTLHYMIMRLITLKQ